MPTGRTTTITLFATLMSSAALIAQDASTVRYELGKRLRRFERDFAALPADAPARAAAVEAMQRAVAGFFSMNLAGVGRALDEGVLAMQPGRDRGVQRGLLALTPRAASHVVAPGATAGFDVVVDDGFEADDDTDTATRFHLDLDIAGTRRGFDFAAPQTQPFHIDWLVPEGPDADLEVRARFTCGDDAVAFPELTVSRVHDAGARVQALQPIATRDGTAPALERLTLRDGCATSRPSSTAAAPRPISPSPDSSPKPSRSPPRSTPAAPSSATRSRARPGCACRPVRAARSSACSCRPRSRGAGARWSSPCTVRAAARTCSSTATATASRRSSARSPAGSCARRAA
ncbi:MAG: hypothetical protein U1F36_04705 [Planctomycetota bacterium]